MKKINKKGSIQDWILVLVILFATTIAIFIGIKIFTEFFGTGVFDSSPTASSIGNTIDQGVLNTFDSYAIGILIGGAVVTALLAFRLKQHPAFFFLGVILLMVVGILAVIFSNTYETFSQSELANDKMEMTDFIMQQLPYLSVIIGAILLVLIYGFNRIDVGL